MALEIEQHWTDSAEQGEDGAYQRIALYRVTSDQPIGNSVEVLIDPRIPAWGTRWEDDQSFIVTNRRLDRDDNTRNAATAVVTYSQRIGSGLPDPQELQNGGQQPTDPLLWYPRISWGPVEGMRVAEYGWLQDPPGSTTGEEELGPITNAADTPYFDPPVEMYSASWQVTYQRNETFPRQEILEYIDVLNSDTFTIDGIFIDYRQALMRPARISPLEFQNGIPYREVTYDIRLKPKFARDGQIVGFDGWNVELQNRGYMYKDGSGGLHRATDADGEPTADPVFLDEDGAVAANPAASDPRIYRLYPEKPFSIWNFQ